MSNKTKNQKKSKVNLSSKPSQNINGKSFWGIFVLGLAGLLVLWGMFSQETPSTKQEPSQGGILKIVRSVYDFGNVRIGQGEVSTEIPFVNIGDGDITIFYLETSCSCTSVSVITEGNEGPRFRMSHSNKKLQDWRLIIKSEQQAKFKIYYDPAVHPKARGALQRTISIYSNDEGAPLQKITIRVNQNA